MSKYKPEGSAFSSKGKQHILEIKRVAPPTAASLRKLRDDLADLAEKYETDYDAIYRTVIRSFRQLSAAADVLDKIDHHASEADLWIGPANMPRPPLDEQ